MQDIKKEIIVKKKRFIDRKKEIIEKKKDFLHRKDLSL